MICYGNVKQFPRDYNQTTKILQKSLKKYLNSNMKITKNYEALSEEEKIETDSMLGIGSKRCVKKTN